MEIGHFYFLSDAYYQDVPSEGLMQNKEPVNGVPHGRPCFYAFFDEATRLFWLIPISSRVEKFDAIYQKKVQRYGKCDTILFGEVLGRKKAFLLQNMCPVTENYISGEYIDARTSLPVRVDAALEAELSKRVRKLLALQRKGARLVFPDIAEIEKQLLGL